MSRRRQKIQVAPGQLSLFPETPPVAAAPEKPKMAKPKHKTKKVRARIPKTPSGVKEVSSEPKATPLMKKVAAAAPGNKSLKKVFMMEEIMEISQRVEDHQGITKEEKIILRERYRKIKRWVSEKEIGNCDKLYVFPSLTSGTLWYKVIGTSALYYAYRLADRMGRKATMQKDTDRVAPSEYLSSLRDIEKFIEQFRGLETDMIERTEDGVLICTLKNPLTPDDIGQLRQIEATRSERLRNSMRPKAMDPEAHQEILMIIRQMFPRIRKMGQRYFYSLGGRMAGELDSILGTYYKFAAGLLPRKEAGEKMLMTAYELRAGTMMMAEIGGWTVDAAFAIGENVAVLERIIRKNFNIGEE